MKIKRLIFITIVFLFLLSLGLGLYIFYLKNTGQSIINFEQCVKAGYPVLESYPRQCRTPDGRSFTEKLSPEDQEELRPPKQGCKDLCGDGICQEIVCMALGCPCAENPKNCPQDCKTDSLNFTYDLQDCQGKKSNLITLLPSGNFLKFVQVFNTYCDAQRYLTIKYNLSGKNIEIREIFDAKTVTRCTCPLEINGRISSLEKGKYYIKFVFDNRYTNQVETLEEEEFELK